jgi:hypothetical protein
VRGESRLIALVSPSICRFACREQLLVEAVARPPASRRRTSSRTRSFTASTPASSPSTPVSSRQSVQPRAGSDGPRRARRGRPGGGAHPPDPRAWRVPPRRSYVHPHLLLRPLRAAARRGSLPPRPGPPACVAKAHFLPYLQFYRIRPRLVAVDARELKSLRAVARLFRRPRAAACARGSSAQGSSTGTIYSPPAAASRPRSEPLPASTRYSAPPRQPSRR